MIKKMRMKKSRRKFLKGLGAMAGAALVPGLATEGALATPITPAGTAPKKKKAAVKRKATTKRKKAAPKRKATAKRKKAAPKRRKVAIKKRAAPTGKIHQYVYQPYTQDSPPRDVPEPSTIGLVSIGVAAVALANRHKKKGKK